MKSSLILSLFAVYGATSMMGCSSSGTKTTSGGEVTMVDGTNESKTAVNQLTLPSTSGTFAFDIDGDGKVDNQLGKIIGTVEATGLDPQSASDATVASGEVLILLDEKSTDATQQSADNAGVTLTLGVKPTTAPKYDGTDTFMLDSTSTPAQFMGDIVAGVFTSNDPKTTTQADVELKVALPLAVGQPVVLLPVIGGRIQFTTDTDGKITGGTINGAIKKTDVDSVVIPAVAALLTAQIMMPGASAALKSFDSNGDGTVTAMELMNNMLISSLLNSDVQMYTNGMFKPNPAKTTPDSLSLGFGFTAVKASF